MKTITVNDNRQKGYKYKLVEPIGKNFDPEFKPPLTPKEMLKLGIMGGKYFDGYHDEYPKDWFKDASLSESGKYEKDKNYFGIKASQPLEVWQKKGWIYKDDPRGWIQWYFRYYMGRRIPEEDQRPTKRFKLQTKAKTGRASLGI
jgi:hypothetical protein